MTTGAATRPQPSVMCPDCGAISYSEKDIENRFCGACNEFHAELLARPIRTLRRINDRFYSMCFWAGVGSDAHAFIEFCGVMSKYIGLLEHATEQGIHPRFINQHCGTPIRVEAHDVQYLAEKLRCIFAPILDTNPEARALFQKELFG